MGLQKYRADKKGDAQPNGAIPWFAVWLGGDSLSKIENCPCDEGIGRRTVYITGEPDTWFSIPAACRVKGKTVRGFVMSDESGFSFVAYKGGA